MLIAVILVAALIGTAYAAVLLAPIWGFIKRSLHEGSNGDNPPHSPRPRTGGEIAFNAVVVSGCISLMIGIACLAVLSLTDPATIVFMTWAAVGFAVWAAFGRRF